MSIRWKVIRPAKISGDEAITIQVVGLEMEIETGSVAEAHGYFQENDARLTEIFGVSVLSRVDFETALKVEAAEVVKDAATVVAAEKPKRTYTRKPAPEAVAPEPLPVPSQEATLAPPLPAPAATPLPANEMALNANGVPAFLDATNRAPPLPVAPTPPPVGVLGPKMVAVLDEKAKGAVDGGQALADWLAQCGLTIEGKTFAEACRAVLMISDEKLKPAADILGVA